MMKGVVVRIVARHDSADDFAVPPREKKRGVAVLEKRMLFAIEKFFTFENQRRHPGRIVAINLPRNLMKAIRSELETTSEISTGAMPRPKPRSCQTYRWSA
jgi:hypothetical protein